MKIKRIFTLLFPVAIFFACSDSSPDTGEPTPPPTGTKTIAINFYDPGKSTSAKYQAVRIGEYLWFNSNINHYPASVETTWNQIELVLNRYRLPVDKYRISLNDINKYYGLYYDLDDAYQYIEGNRHNYQIKEDNKDVPAGTSWGAPGLADLAQLFAMCGNGTESDVRTTLTCKPGSNPAAVSDYTYWFTNANTNKYGFNLMPGGARFHNNDKWTIKHDHNDNDVDVVDVVRGDFYGFVEAAVLKAWDGRVTIDDYIKFHVDKEHGKIWHLTTIRWCRKLTDEELGYKLYINQNKTDIVKLGLQEPAPSGYTELDKGALRGFYVQFIIGGQRPNATVPQMVELAKKLSY